MWVFVKKSTIKKGHNAFLHQSLFEIPFDCSMVWTQDLIQRIAEYLTNKLWGYIIGKKRKVYPKKPPHLPVLVYEYIRCTGAREPNSLYVHLIWFGHIWGWQRNCKNSINESNQRWQLPLCLYDLYLEPQIQNGPKLANNTFSYPQKKKSGRKGASYAFFDTFPIQSINHSAITRPCNDEVRQKFNWSTTTVRLLKAYIYYNSVWRTSVPGIGSLTTDSI